VLFESPQSKRHWCASIETTEHSAGGLNGRAEAGATVANGDIDGSAVGADGEGSTVAGAEVIGAHAVSKNGTPAATRNTPMRTTRR